MERKLSDIVIMSDVDGTLVHKGQPVSRRNVDALERFVSKGGRFGIATGRSRRFTQPLVDSLPVNFPCVLFNGGVLYDYAQDRYLMEMFCPDAARDYIAEIMERFPQCGAIAVNAEDYLDLDGSAQSYRDVYFNETIKVIKSSQFSGTMLKSLILLNPEFRPEFCDYTDKRQFPGVRFTFTNDHLIEMLPELSSKGYALKRLAEIENLRKENLVAIGDYYNDREMIEFAGIGVTMHTAPEDLKALADILVCDCPEGSLGDLVEQLEERFA